MHRHRWRHQRLSIDPKCWDSLTIKESYFDSNRILFTWFIPTRAPETNSSIPQFYDALCQSSLALTGCNSLDTWWRWCWKNCYLHLPGPFSTIGATRTLTSLVSMITYDLHKPQTSAIHSRKSLNRLYHQVNFLIVQHCSSVKFYHPDYWVSAFRTFEPKISSYKKNHTWMMQRVIFLGRTQETSPTIHLNKINNNPRKMKLKPTADLLPRSFGVFFIFLTEWSLYLKTSQHCSHDSTVWKGRLRNL